MSSATSESEEELSLEESLLACSRRGQTRILEDILQSRKDGTIHVDINCKGLTQYIFHHRNTVVYCLCGCYLLFNVHQIACNYCIYLLDRFRAGDMFWSNNSFYSPCIFLYKSKCTFSCYLPGNTKANRGWTPLHLAAYFGYLDTVKHLMQVSLATWTLSNS